MKENTHPDYKKTTIKCVCGNEIETGSVEENITVEICKIGRASCRDRVSKSV